MSQTNAEFLRYYLDTACDQALDYDACYAQLAKFDSEEFDVFVHLAYEFSEMKLTPDDMRRASKMLANLAVSVLQFNVCESGDNDEEVIDAAAEAGQPQT